MIANKWGDMETEALAQANILRAEATALLENRGLRRTLEAAGPVQVVGSYALDLMVRPDLDFTVRLPHDHDFAAFYELGSRIAGGFAVGKMEFWNAFLHPDGPLDHGLYWGVQLPHAGRFWNLDIWGFGEKAYAAHMRSSEELAARLASVDRGMVLGIKGQLSLRPGYGNEPASWQVYEAITRHGVRSVEEFDAWWEAGNERR